MNSGIMISTQTQKNGCIIQCTEIESWIDDSLSSIERAGVRQCVCSEGVWERGYIHTPTVM